MIKHALLLITGFLFTALVSASELQLDNTYDVFGGKPVSLKSYIGKKPVYLKFWATWCLDCRRELPHLQETYEKYHDKIAMFAVNLNINETDEYIKRLQQKNNLTIPIVMDNNNSIAGNFQFQGTPFHVLIDKSGTVVYTTYKDDEALAQQIDQLATQGAINKPDSNPPLQTANTIAPLPQGTALVYLSAAWCDWYMKDIHPEMSANCVNATEVMNKLYDKYPQMQLQSYVTHLWTEAKDAEEYRKKFSIQYPVSIDSDNQVARRLKAVEYPVLLVFKDGVEIKRFTRFDSPKEIVTTIDAQLKKQ